MKGVVGKGLLIDHVQQFDDLRTRNLSIHVSQKKILSVNYFFVYKRSPVPRSFVEKQFFAEILIR